MRRSSITLIVAVAVLVAVPTIAWAGPPGQDGPGQGDALSGLDAVIGTLGLYAAMMAVLAVGTEVMIDAVRPVFGLQRRKTATAALSDLKNWLPSTTAQLGLAPDAQEQLAQALDRLDDVASHFDERVNQAKAIIQEQVPNILKNLALQSADEALEAHWPELEQKLAQLGPDVDTAVVHAWLAETLNQLKGVSVAEINSSLRAINNLLQAVVEYRHQIQSPMRRLWRWLRDAPWSRAWLGEVLLRLQYAWDWLRGQLPDEHDLERYAEYVRNPRMLQPVRTMEEAAQRLLELDVQEQREEKARITWLRILSAVVGTVLAAMLQVDTFQLLSPLMGEMADEVTRTFGEIMGFTAPAFLAHLTPGIILSGLGAAAGSGFWHDQLSKLRNAKRAVAQVEEVASALKR